MGMYTELIIDVVLHNLDEKSENIIKWMVESGDIDVEPEKPDHEFFKCDRRVFLFTCDIDICHGHTPVFKKENNVWILQTDAEIKNYESEIEKFLDWLDPFVKEGKLENGAFANSIYEEVIDGCIKYFKDHRIEDTQKYYY